MLISLQKRFVLISNAKAGSTSLEDVLSPYAEIGLRTTKGGKHASWQETRKQFHFLFEHPDYQPESFFRFGVVWDPLDRLVSWYNYRLDPTRKQRDLEPMSIEAFWKLDDWVKWSRGGEKKLQRSVFLDDDGVCRFDLVLPLDQLSANQSRLGARLRVDLSIPKSNVSHKTISKRDLSPEFAEEVREFYKEDYAFLAEWREKVTDVLGEDGLFWAKKPQTGVAYLHIEEREEPASGLVGIAVPEAAIAEGASLQLVQRGVQAELNWGLPSPRYANRFGDNPMAAHAKFRLARAGGRIYRGAEIVLTLADGTSQVLAVLEKKPPPKLVARN